MLVSRLRHQVQFYNLTYVEGKYGDEVPRYVPAFIEWAEVRSIPGEEFRDAVFTYSKVPYRILVRYREGITALMKVRNLTNGMTLDVEAVRDPDGKREILELQCLWKENDQSDFEDD